GVTHFLSVLPLAGSTTKVTGGPWSALVEVMIQLPLASIQMPLPWMDSVCTLRRILPSDGLTSNTLLGSTWSRIRSVPLGVNCSALGSLMVGASFQSLWTV